MTLESSFESEDLDVSTPKHESFGSRLRRRLSPRWKSRTRPSSSYLYSDIPTNEDWDDSHRSRSSVKRQLSGCLTGVEDDDSLNEDDDFMTDMTAHQLKASMVQPLLFAQNQAMAVAGIRPSKHSSLQKPADTTVSNTTSPATKRRQLPATPLVKKPPPPIYINQPTSAAPSPDVLLPEFHRNGLLGSRQGSDAEKLVQQFLQTEGLDHCIRPRELVDEILSSNHQRGRERLSQSELSKAAHNILRRQCLPDHPATDFVPEYEIDDPFEDLEDPFLGQQPEFEDFYWLHRSSDTKDMNQQPMYNSNVYGNCQSFSVKRSSKRHKHHHSSSHSNRHRRSRITYSYAAV